MMVNELEELKDLLSKAKALEIAMRLNLELISLKMRDFSLAHTQMQVAIRQLEAKLLSRAQNYSA